MLACLTGYKTYPADRLSEKANRFDSLQRGAMSIQRAFLLSTLLFSHGLLNAHDNYNIRSASVPEFQQKQEERYKTIHTEELKEKIRQSPSSFVIVDARSAEDDDGQRIPGAIFLPFDAEEKVIVSTLPNKEATIVVYCTSVDCPISEMLADRLVQMGYVHVMKYAEGIEGWQKSGNKVETVKKADAEAKTK